MVQTVAVLVEERYRDQKQPASLVAALRAAGAHVDLIGDSALRDWSPEGADVVGVGDAVRVSRGCAVAAVATGEAPALVWAAMRAATDVCAGASRAVPAATAASSSTAVTPANRPGHGRTTVARNPRLLIGSSR